MAFSDDDFRMLADLYGLSALEKKLKRMLRNDHSDQQAILDLRNFLLGERSRIGVG